MYRLTFLLFVPLLSIFKEKTPFLETKATLKIYSAEILESVIRRVGTETGESIVYSTLMLLPYKCKARDYKDAPIKDILDDQLSGTPLKYRVRKNHLEIFNALTLDSSADILIPIK